MIIKSAVRGDYSATFHSLEDIGHQCGKITEKYYFVSKTIAEMYNKAFPWDAPRLVYDVTEETKTLDKGCCDLLKFLAHHQATKRATLVAIGGGAIQDIACLASQIYKRGIDWVFVPTTLLSQLDSCIGGKSGINIGPYKNLIGGFWPPTQVYLCPDFLKTLPPNDIKSGLGECIKHTMLSRSTPAEFKLILSDLEEGVIKLGELVEANLKIKKEFIEQDEFDTGKRLLLGLGHTFGHALEGASDFSIPHGVAVALGCDMAWFISARRGLTEWEQFENWHPIIMENFLKPTKNYTRGMMERFGADKKAGKREVNFVLFHGILAGLHGLPIDEVLEKDLHAYFERAIR